MTITADKIERLVFVKYLLKQAEASKELDRPLSSTTVLTLHDAVECFLQLSYQQLTKKAKINGQNILDTYAEKINEQLTNLGEQLINRAFIKRINELRNQLKHATIFIDSRNIQNLFSETELFFIDFTQIIFKFDFNTITLIDLVSNNEIRQHLLAAENQIHKSNFQLAMYSIGKAFYELEDFRMKAKGKYGDNILAKHHIVHYLIKYEARFGGQQPDKILKENLEEIAEDINRLQEEIYDLKKVISLSADLKKYAIFKNIVPHVSKIVKGATGEIEFWIPDEERKNKVEYSIEQVKFCFDFVTETALLHNT